MTEDKNWDIQGRAYGKSLVITDVRYPNEADFIHKYGGELWRVDRKTLSHERATLVLLPYDNGIGINHSSERFVSRLPADRVLEAANIDSLRQRVREAMSELAEA